MKQSLIDITPKMGVRTPVYPGDPPFVVRLTASVAAGDPADVSAVSFSAHCGAHVDAPAHLFPGTGDAASLPLERFVGPCLVIDLTELEPEAAPSELVRPQTIAAVKALMGGKALPSRVLIKTRRSQPPVWSSASFHPVIHSFYLNNAQECQIMAHKVFEKPIRVHFSNCDPAGIVFHPQYFVLINELMEDFLEDVAGVGFIEIRRYGVGFPVVSVKTQFTKPSRPSDRLMGQVWVEKIGDKSIRFAFVLKDEAEERLRCVETSVCVKLTSDDQFVSWSIPAEIREALAPYVVESESEFLQIRA